MHLYVNANKHNGMDLNLLMLRADPLKLVNVTLRLTCPSDSNGFTLIKCGLICEATVTNQKVLPPSDLSPLKHHLVAEKYILKCLV